jgi:hypothetical protein
MIDINILLDNLHRSREPTVEVPQELRYCLYCDCHYVEEEYVAERAACTKCQELFELYEE